MIYLALYRTQNSTDMGTICGKNDKFDLLYVLCLSVLDGNALVSFILSLCFLTYRTVEMHPFWAS